MTGFGHSVLSKRSALCLPSWQALCKQPRLGSEASQSDYCSLTKGVRECPNDAVRGHLELPPAAVNVEAVPWVKEPRWAQGEGGIPAHQTGNGIKSRGHKGENKKKMTEMS